MKSYAFLIAVLFSGCAATSPITEQPRISGVFVDRGFDSGLMIHLRADHSYAEEEYGMGAQTTPRLGTWSASGGRIILVPARGKARALEIRQGPEGARLEGEDQCFVFWMDSYRYDAMQFELRALNARFDSGAISRRDRDNALYEIGLKYDALKRPNKAPEPTPTAVTSPATQEPRHP